MEIDDIRIRLAGSKSRVDAALRTYSAAKKELRLARHAEREALHAWGASEPFFHIFRVFQRKRP